MSYSPSVRQRGIARTLVQWRKRANIATQAEAATLAGWAPAKQSRIEGAKQEIDPRDVVRLAAVYNVPPEESQDMVNRALLAANPSWVDRIQKDALTADFRDYVNLETEAHRVRRYRNDVVDGLLQTEAYAIERAKLQLVPADPETSMAAIAARLQRQSRLRDEDFEAWFVLAESILLDGKITPETMREQREHLLEVAEIPGVKIRILTPDCGAPPIGLSFSILSFDDADPDVGYVEMAHTGVYLEDEAVDPYGLAFDRLWQQALTEEESVELIAAIDRQ